MPLIQIGQKAEVRAEAYPERVFEGTVTRVVHALNRQTRTMTVEVDLPNKDHHLKGGMFARVEVLVGTHRHAIQIPSDALTRLRRASICLRRKRRAGAATPGRNRRPGRQSY